MLRFEFSGPIKSNDVPVLPRVIEGVVPSVIVIILVPEEFWNS